MPCFGLTMFSIQSDMLKRKCNRIKCLKLEIKNMTNTTTQATTAPLFVKVFYKKTFGEYEDTFFKVFKIEEGTIDQGLPEWIDREVYESETYDPEIAYEDREVLGDEVAPFVPFWVNSEMTVAFQYPEVIPESDYEVLYRHQ